MATPGEDMSCTNPSAGKHKVARGASVTVFTETVEELSSPLTSMMQQTVN